MKKAVFAFAALAAVAGSAMASFSEGFEGAVPGWQIFNASNPVGTTQWGISTGNVFPAFAGNNHAFANFNATGSVGTISAWLFSPVDTIQNGDVLKFWTRTVDGNPYPDRMQVRLSTNGASTNVGASEFSVGDFSTLLLDINPTLDPSPTGYPEGWTQFSITISGLMGPVSGRFGFRYFVDDAGAFGLNSNYIGLDDVEFTSIPAPGALALAGLLGLTAGRRRR
jgi:hypothetical protein